MVGSCALWSVQLRFLTYYLAVFSRMRSRRVPVLKLGSRGPGGDARSLRSCPQSVRNRSQSSASVRNRSRRVAHAVEAKIVAKRRPVVTFCVLHYKSLNSHRDRGGRGREIQNCRHFWTRLVSSRLKSVNSHRDRGGSWSRNPELSSLLDSPRVLASQKCQQSQGSGGLWSGNPELSSLLDSSRLVASQKCQQSQGSGGIVVAKRKTVVTFGLASGLGVSKVSTVTGIGGVVVAKSRTVVTFGLASGLGVSKVSTVTGIGGDRGRETQNCRHFWTRLRSSHLKSVNSHRDRGGRGRET